MNTKRRRYLAYLLRLWQTGGEEEPAWRASVEDAHTGERRGFACLEELFKFLQAETGARSPTKDGEGSHKERTMKARLFTIPLLIILTLAVTLPGIAGERTPLAGDSTRWGMRLAAASPRPPAGPAAQPWQAPERPCPDERVISVNTTDDELNSDGDCSLREAIEAANTNTVVDGCVEGCRDDTIFVPSGTYTLTIAGAGEDNNQTGDLDILDSAFITGEGADLTILDGNDLDRVLEIHPGWTVTVNAMTITHGRVYDQDGGGILNQGMLVVNDAVLTKNTVVSPDGYGGGGLANDAMVQDATVTLNNSQITKNTGGCCGGLANLVDTTGVRATMTLNHCLVSNNTGVLFAGGVYNGLSWSATDAASILTLTDSVVENNSGGGEWAGGGGIWNQGLLTQNVTASLTVDHSAIRGNTAVGPCDQCGWGGGIGSYASAVVVEASTISGNIASGGAQHGGQGGGIWLAGGAATISNSTISGNQAIGPSLPNPAGLGGGIENAAPEWALAEDSTLTVINTTVVGNSASTAGGGIDNQYTGNWQAVVTFKNVLIDDNSAPAGSGESCFNGDWGAGPGTLTSLGYNMEDYDYCGFGQPTDLPSTDALLYPLADNDGDTETHALRDGSPAIDRGSCPGFAADQRGLPRPVDIPGIADADDGCDVGAYELQSLSLIGLSKTAGTDPAACAETDTIILPPAGGEVTYCYRVENSGTVALTLHELWDDQLGQLLSGPYELEPGETWWLTATAAITEATVNTATWTAYNPGLTDVVSATDTATVQVRLPYSVYLPVVTRSGP